MTTTTNQWPKAWSPASPPALRASTARLAHRAPRPLRRPVLFIGAHVVLGILAARVTPVATAHAVAIAVVALATAVLARHLERIIEVAAYCSVCDVFWRMTGSAAPWEFGKYITITTLGIAFVRFVRRRSGITAPVLFILLLMPACVVSYFALGGGARELISSNLSGPVLLGVAVMVLRRLVATHQELSTLLLVMLGPIAAVAAIATTSTLAAANTIAFSNDSNFVSSGGFGPNQISNTLGLGALICVLLCLFSFRLRQAVVLIPVAVWLASQAALTFSRGGVYSLVLALISVTIAALATSTTRSRALVGAVIAVLLVVAAYPALNEFTQGNLATRFGDTNSTNRNVIASADSDLFRREPLLGVGVGVAKFERASTGKVDIEARAHTEYTRLLAEHGAFGVAAIILLVAMAIHAFKKPGLRQSRLIAAGCISWSAFTMAHSATSTASVGFVFGIAQLRTVSARANSETS